MCLEGSVLPCLLNDPSTHLPQAKLGSANYASMGSSEASLGAERHISYSPGSTLAGTPVNVVAAQCSKLI